MFPATAFVWAILTGVTWFAAKLLYDHGTSKWRLTQEVRDGLRSYILSVVARGAAIVLGAQSLTVMALHHSSDVETPVSTYAWAFFGALAWFAAKLLYDIGTSEWSATTGVQDRLSMTVVYALSAAAGITTIMLAGKCFLLVAFGHS